MAQFAITKHLTPVFNTPAIQTHLLEMKLDEQNLWRPLETLLRKGITLTIPHLFQTGICEIQTLEYPSKDPLYTHSFFLKSLPELFEERSKPALPDLSIFLSRIQDCVRKKVPYLWGGNAPLGTHVLKQLYQKPLFLDEKHQQIWDLKGVDCSGLIYWATRGATPRNTAKLVYEGSAVPIYGLSASQIVSLLKPGMMIVWKGHVLVVTEEGIVDSSVGKGVCLNPSFEKLQEICSTRVPLDVWPREGTPLENSFVVRDLYPSDPS